MSKRFSNISNPTGQNSLVVLGAVADALGYITGQQQPRIVQLPTTATTADCIAKINEVIARLQGQ